MAAAGVPRARDLALAFDLDRRREPIGEAKTVRSAQLVEVLDHIGRRLVVVRHPDVERQAGSRLEPLRRESMTVR